jgi:hypothetical protein
LDTWIRPAARQQPAHAHKHLSLCQQELSLLFNL